MILIICLITTHFTLTLIRLFPFFLWTNLDIHNFQRLLIQQELKKIKIAVLIVSYAIVINEISDNACFVSVLITVT